MRFCLHAELHCLASVLLICSMTCVRHWTSLLADMPGRQVRESPCSPMVGDFSVGAQGTGKRQSCFPESPEVRSIRWNWPVAILEEFRIFVSALVEVLLMELADNQWNKFPPYSVCPTGCSDDFLENRILPWCVIQDTARPGTTGRRGASLGGKKISFQKGIG